MECLLSLSPQAVLNAQIKSSNPAFHVSSTLDRTATDFTEIILNVGCVLRLKGGQSLPLSGGVRELGPVHRRRTDQGAVSERLSERTLAEGETRAARYKRST